MRTSKGYAINKAPSGQPEQWCHLFPRRETTAMCGHGEIARIEVVEDSEGTHYAFWENERERWLYLWYDRGLTEMCFPYGSKAEEQRGRGQLCSVRIVRLEG